MEQSERRICVALAIELQELMSQKFVSPILEDAGVDWYITPNYDRDPGVGMVMHIKMIMNKETEAVQVICEDFVIHTTEGSIELLYEAFEDDVDRMGNIESLKKNFDVVGLKYAQYRW